ARHPAGHRRGEATVRAESGVSEQLACVGVLDQLREQLPDHAGRAVKWGNVHCQVCVARWPGHPRAGAGHEGAAADMATDETATLCLEVRRGGRPYAYPQ